MQMQTSSSRLFDTGACLQDVSQIRVALLPLTRMTSALRQGIKMLTELNTCNLTDARLFYCQETDKPVLPRMPWDKGKCALRYLVEPESRHATFWADLHAHLRPLALVGVADGTDMISLNDAMDQFEYKAKELNVKVLRLFIFGGTEKWRARAEASPKGAHVSFLPPVDDPGLPSVLRQTALDLTACLIMRCEAIIATAGPSLAPSDSPLDRSEVLTGQKSALEDVQKAAARLTSNEEEDRRRRQGRLRKMLGDLSLSAGSPEDALEHYRGALEASKAAADSLWLAGVHECLAAAKFQLALLSRGMEHLTQPGEGERSGGPVPPSCLAVALRKEEIKAVLNDVRPHLLEAITVYKKRGILDRAAASHVRLARFLGQLNGASSKSSRLELLESLWAALDLALQTRPELRLGCVVEVANALGEAGCVRKRGLLLREAAEVAFDQAGQSLLSSLELALQGATRGDGPLKPVPSNPRVLPLSLHGLPSFAPLVGVQPEHRSPWARLEAECLKAAVGASASEKREGAMWDAACRLLRDHTANLSAEEQGLLIKDLEKAAERIRTTLAAVDATSAPPPPPGPKLQSFASLPSSPAPLQAAPSQHARSPSTIPPPPPSMLAATPTLTPTNSLSPPAPTGVTLGPAPLVSLGGFIEPPEPHWPLQMTFGGAKKTKKTGPFLYAAFKPKGGQKAGPLGWVVGEAAAVEVEVSNPLDIELKLDRLCLTAELSPSQDAPSSSQAATSREDGTAHPPPPGPLPVLGIPITATLAPRVKDQRVVLLIVVPSPGNLRLTGCEVTWLGITWREGWQGLPAPGQQGLLGSSKRAAHGKGGKGEAAPTTPESVIPVFAPLPMLALRILPDADVLRENAPSRTPASPDQPSSPTPLPPPPFQPKLVLLEGERRTLSLEVRNEGTLPADRARLSLSPKGSLPNALRVTWDEGRLTESLPLAPGKALKVPVHVEALGSQGSPADLSDLTLHCTLEYLGNSADGDEGIGRRCSYKFGVEVQPAVSVLRAQVVERASSQAPSNPRPSRLSALATRSITDAGEREPLPGLEDLEASTSGDAGLWSKWDIGRAYAPELVLQVEVENRYSEELTFTLRRVHFPSIVQGNSDDHPGMPPPPVVIDPSDVAQLGQSARAAAGSKTRAMIVAESWTEGCTAYLRPRTPGLPPAEPSASTRSPGSKEHPGQTPPTNPKDAAHTLSMFYCLDWAAQGKEAPRSGTLLLLPSLFEPCMGSLQIRQQLFPAGVISLLGASVSRRSEVTSASLTSTSGLQGASAPIDFQLITREMFARPDDLTLLRSTQGVRLRLFSPLTLGVRVYNRTPSRCCFKLVMQCFSEDNAPAPTAATFAGVNRGVSLQLDAGASWDHEVTVIFREAGLFYLAASITEVAKGMAGGVKHATASNPSDAAAGAAEVHLETFSRPMYVVVKN